MGSIPISQVTLMSHPLDGAQAKVERSHDQLQTLVADLDAFRQGEPHKVISENDSDAREWTIRFQVLKPFERVVAVQIGEIVHNLHSALDHLVWQLAILEAETPSKSTKLQFPVFLTESGYRERGNEKLPGVSVAAKALIESLQPFATGEDRDSPLWHLYSLSVWDKHKDVPLAGMLSQRFVFGPVRMKDVEHIILAGPQLLKHDAVIGVIRMKPGASYTPPNGVKMKTQVIVVEAFEQPEAVAGREVTTTLGKCGERVNEILEQFRTQIFVER